MGKEKIIEFIGSDEFFRIVEEIGNFLKITWEDERMPKIINLAEDILRYNQTSETPVKELIKKWLDFLNEDEVNNLYQFLNENFLPKVRELWQEKNVAEEEVEKTEEESFEEREKRYLELMKTIIQYPQKPKEKIEKEESKKEEPEKEIEEYKTITFEPQEQKLESQSEEKTIFISKETPQQNLPEGTIIITTKKEEEEPKEKDEKILDFSDI
jgi:chemotaxis protein histidine kinase CheA